jgi:predicted SAM-dependent methyltransferase
MNVKYDKLDIGCGANKCSPDAVGIDVAAGPGVDIVGDALDILRAMDANSVGSIYSSHFLEHHEFPDKILKEMIRIIIPEGSLELRVPHFSDPWFHSDPTHKHSFGLYTFAYYFKNSIFSRKLPSYCLIDGAHIETINLTFGSTRPFYVRHGFKKIVQFLVNINNYTRELYEELFPGVLNCSEIHVIIKKDLMQ